MNRLEQASCILAGGIALGIGVSLFEDHSGLPWKRPIDFTDPADLVVLVSLGLAAIWAVRKEKA